MGEVSGPELWMEWNHMEDSDEDPVVSLDQIMILNTIPLIVLQMRAHQLHSVMSQGKVCRHRFKLGSQRDI